MGTKCQHVVSTRLAGCRMSTSSHAYSLDRSLSRVSKGARASNCHGPRLALIRHWTSNGQFTHKADSECRNHKPQLNHTASSPNMRSQDKQMSCLCCKYSTVIKKSSNTQTLRPQEDNASVSVRKQHCSTNISSMFHCQSRSR